MSVQRLYSMMTGWLINMEQFMTWELAGTLEVLREILPQCHFVHQKSHVSWPVIELSTPPWEVWTMAWPLFFIFLNVLTSTLSSKATWFRGIRNESNLKFLIEQVSLAATRLTFVLRSPRCLIMLPVCEVHKNNAYCRGLWVEVIRVQNYSTNFNEIWNRMSTLTFFGEVNSGLVGLI
jgi:hypothetical protein